MAKIHLEIVSPEKVVLKKEVDSLTLPTVEGEITVLPGHSQFIAALDHGSLQIRDNGREDVFSILGGFIQVQKDSRVLVMADASEHISEIDEKKAEEARQRAEKLLTEVRDDEERFAEVNAELLRSLTRLKLVKKHRTKRSIDLS